MLQSITVPLINFTKEYVLNCYETNNCDTNCKTLHEELHILHVYATKVLRNAECFKSCAST